MSEKGGEVSEYDQMRAIRAEIAREEPLISDKQSLAQLQEELKSNQAQAEQISLISRVYPSFRRVRRDGDCFYRAFLLGIFEFCAQEKNAPAAEKLLEKLGQSVEALGKYHAPMILEDFWDVFQELLVWIKTDRPNPDEIIDRLSDSGTACYIITFARLLTSLRLRENADTFTYFLPEGSDIHTFVTQSVEPLGQEADHVQVVALAQQTGVNLRIVYLDRQQRGGGSDTATNASQSTQSLDSNQPLFSFEDVFGANEGLPSSDAASNEAQNDIISLVLLYRPGHYDILYQSA